MSLLLKTFFEFVCYTLGSFIGIWGVKNLENYHKDNDKGSLFFFFWDMIMFAVVTSIAIWLVIFL